MLLFALAVFGIVVGGIVALTLNAMPADDEPAAKSGTTSADPATAAAPAQTTALTRLPAEIRGVHVTAALASIRGKLDQEINFALLIIHAARHGPKYTQPFHPISGSNLKDPGTR